MAKFVVEREMPGAGRLSPADLKGAAQTSREVLREMGPDIQWVESYVADDKLYCVYHAANAEILREHARRAGFPADRIERVSRVIDPSTADAPTA